MNEIIAVSNWIYEPHFKEDQKIQMINELYYTFGCLIRKNDILKPNIDNIIEINDGYTMYRHVIGKLHGYVIGEKEYKNISNLLTNMWTKCRDREMKYFIGELRDMLIFKKKILPSDEWYRLHKLHDLGIISSCGLWKNPNF